MTAATVYTPENTRPVRYGPNVTIWEPAPWPNLWASADGYYAEIHYDGISWQANKFNAAGQNVDMRYLRVTDRDDIAEAVTDGYRTFHVPVAMRIGYWF